MCLCRRSFDDSLKSYFTSLALSFHGKVLKTKHATFMLSRFCCCGRKEKCKCSGKLGLKDILDCFLSKCLVAKQSCKIACETKLSSSQGVCHKSAFLKKKIHSNGRRTGNRKSRVCVWMSCMEVHSCRHLIKAAFSLIYLLRLETLFT